MKTAAIYCRVSTEDQEREGTSLQTQLEACLKYCQDKDYNVRYRFSEAYSGLTLERPKLNELRELVRAGNIDVIVVYCLDRLSRDPVHGVILIEELEKHHVDLEAVTETIDSSEVGKLISYIRGFASKLEAEKIRERTMRGKKANCRAGKFATGGPAPFGYDLVVLDDKKTKKRVISESQAVIVRSVFNLFANEGSTLYQAVEKLNEANLEAPRAGKWGENTVLRILNNTAYMGITYAFRYKAVKAENQRTKMAYSKHIIRDKSEWILIPDASPAIVSKEVFDAAHRQLQLNRQKSPHNKRNQYLFTGGRFRCGICGHSMVGSVKKKAKGDWRYYRCVCNIKTNYYDHCSQHSIAADLVESLVWNEISKVLSQPEVAIEELNKLRTQNTPGMLEADMIFLENNIANAKAEEVKYLRQYGRGVISEEQLDTEAKRVHHYLAQQQEKLESLKAQEEAILKATTDYDKVSNSLATIAKQITNADYEVKQLALDMLDIKVTLSPTGEIHIAGIIPSEVNVMLQTDRSPLRHHLG